MMGSPNHQTVMSPGGGVQCSVMAGDGAFGGLPKCAIFADSHWETKAEGTGSGTSVRGTVACEKWRRNL